MSRILLMNLSLCTVIILNIIASFFSLNGLTTAEITKRLPLLFIPANYVLISSWGLYILFFFWIFNFHKTRHKMSTTQQNRITFLFVLNCLLQFVWIFQWHFELFTGTVFTRIVHLLVLLLLYLSYPKRENQLLGRAPISLLTGWVFITVLSNSSYLLMIHGWTGFGLSDPLWAVIYLTVSTAFALHFMYHHKDYVMNLVFVWAFVGIAVMNGTEELFISAAAIFLSAVIIACIFLFSNRRTEH
ncbi:tryptophan-rich sensory protein [Sporosarcina sp. ACRSL]|uniref:tryptophan-rich sensory protein n=1 Tax=Sporosarcina sp. ACRSL TaxID=2918215 RepID=UPI001EF50A1A|nr:tryptophan-rich sensory protein [Sporosarcina sp. ACRSL]MCG7345737.1 tryptophan-rich sensory protein [Sporosarcina sp. ACRSL]